MKYMGSKARVAHEILPIILSGRRPGQYYVEPFCGGLGTMDRVSGPRIAGDLNRYLIAMWNGLKSGEPRPYSIPKEMYDLARKDYRGGTNRHFSDFEIGWIGWMASFNGRFFDGGYSGSSGGRDYIREQIRNTERQIERIRDVEFIASDYSLLPIPEGSIVYCDIPYAGTKRYDVSRQFDHARFWRWAADMKNLGHTVFVSEYTAPEGVECVWSKEVVNTLCLDITHRPTEKLFKL
jgi:DNA adenine methylase